MWSRSTKQRRAARRRRWRERFLALNRATLQAPGVSLADDDPLWDVLRWMTGETKSVEVALLRQAIREAVGWGFSGKVVP